MKKEYKKPFVCIKESKEVVDADTYIPKVKAAGNLLLREIAGESILIPVGEMALKIHGMISLSESGAILWQKLQKECTEEELVDAILKEYDIDWATAVEDVQAFLKKMRKIGIIVCADGE